MQQTRLRATETRPPASRAGGNEARRMRQELRQSMREGGLSLAFQPRCRLADHAALGADAHLRWQSRSRGVVHATALMPLLDEIDLAQEVLAWTLDAACAAAAGWPDGMVSISVPALSLGQASLLPLIGEALAAHGLPPERLEIALPDAHVPADRDDTLLSLAALRDAGIAVALEEFGAAGACLIKLKHLPLSAIKLARPLLRDVVFDQAASVMVRALIGYAHALDIEVAAHVENAGQRSLLRQMGCDVGMERAGSAW